MTNETKPRRRPGDTWTRAERNFLKREYGAQTAPDLAVVLGRSAEAVKAKCKELGLKKAQESIRAIRKLPNKGWFEPKAQPKTTTPDERPTPDEADRLLSRGRRLVKGKMQLTHEGLAALTPSQKQRLVKYLTGHRLPVYDALIEPFDFEQRQWLSSQGYEDNHWLADDLPIWQPTATPSTASRRHPPSSFT